MISFMMLQEYCLCISYKYKFSETVLQNLIQTYNAWIEGLSITFSQISKLMNVVALVLLVKILASFVLALAESAL